MRVLHLTTHLNMGGITIYIYRLIAPLRKLGIETFVLSGGGDYAEKFRKRGATVFELPIRTKSEINPRIYLALPELKKIIRENKIDLIHAHTRVTQVMAFWIQKMTAVPVVATCHGFYKRRLGRRLLPAWGDRTIAISEGVAGHLENDLKVPKEKIRTVQNGIDLEEIDKGYAKHVPAVVKKEYGFKEQDPVIGVVARLVQDKGHEYLIDAIRILRKEFPAIRLLIVGDGKFRPALQKLVEQLKLTDAVYLLGNIEDVTKPLSAINIFALPATWREGFGLSIVEAMACRKPVIVSNIWALNTLIQNESTGILVEPKKSDVLAAAIAKLLKDPAKQRVISEKGRQAVEKYFGIDRMADGLAGVYKELVPG